MMLRCAHCMQESSTLLAQPAVTILAGNALCGDHFGKATARRTT